MKWLSLIIVSFLLIEFGSAHAEEQTISVPGEGWRIRFDAPKLTPTTGVVPSIFFGRADRFQLSLFVESPRCPGGDSNDSIYACWSKILQQNPYVAWDTERANTTPNGVQVMYMNTGGAAFNINLYFVRNGKWADLHTSVTSPKKEDVMMLLSIMQSVVIEEDSDSATNPSENSKKAP